MNPGFDAATVVILGTAIALFYWLARALGGWLVQNGAEPVGRAMLSVFP